MRYRCDMGEDVGTGSGDYGYIWKDLLISWIDVGFEEKESNQECLSDFDCEPLVK